MPTLANHDLTPGYQFERIGYETRPVLDRDGKPVAGLHHVWITLRNEAQLNSYTTSMVKEVIMAFRRASCDREAVAVIFTGAGNRSFCTGGNTEEYATYYANRPLEYLQYMRLFNDMVTGILLCDKPTICRVNGLRIAGGQEIGMACDFTIAGDHAQFGQAGPVHGSAPDGGATDFLDLYVGFGRAAESLVLCQPWSAYKALRLGLINGAAKVYRNAEGAWVPNPMVETHDWVRDGEIVFGEFKEGAARDEAKTALAKLTLDLSALDAQTGKLVTRLMYLFPDCTRKTLESLRKKKLEWWNRNAETNRSWLALNMNAEAAAGFPAFHFGNKTEREIDFAALRRALAAGARFDDALVASVLPASAAAGWKAHRTKGE